MESLSNLLVKVDVRKLSICLLLIPVAIFCHSCAVARKEFAIPGEIPVLQLIVDKNSEFGTRDTSVPLIEGLRNFRERLTRADEGETRVTVKPDLSCGLLVPVSADGYCLTVAHNVDEGQSLTLLDLDDLRPLFLYGSKGDDGIPNTADEDGTPLVSTMRIADGRSGWGENSEPERRNIEAIAGPLDLDDFKTVRSELGGLGLAALIPVEVVKVWKADDLALIKVPFSTPGFFPLAREEVAIGESIMVFGNPVVHEGVLNAVSKRLDATVNWVKFEKFYPIITRDRGRGFIQKGDSGGPAINRRGELVGIHRAGGEDEKGEYRWVVSIGIRADVVQDAIRESEIKVGGA